MRPRLLCFFLSLLLLSAAHGGGDHDADADGDTTNPVDLRARPLILVKICSLILVFVGTFIGRVSPYFLKWNEGFLVLGTRFAGGVFLRTALIHFLSDAHETFGDLTDKAYPFAFMLACAGYLVTMLADCVISSVYGKERSDGNGDLELQGSIEQEKRRHNGTSQSHLQMHGGQDHTTPKSSVTNARSLGDSILLIVALCFHCL